MFTESNNKFTGWLSVVSVIQLRPSHKLATTAIAIMVVLSPPPLCSSFRSSQSPPSSLIGGIEVLDDDDDNNIGNDATMGEMAGPFVISSSIGVRDVVGGGGRTDIIIIIVVGK